jgi:hypothetical protein
LVTIQAKLQANFGDITLNINTNKLKTQTLAQKETQAGDEKMASFFCCQIIMV